MAQLSIQRNELKKRKIKKRKRLDGKELPGPDAKARQCSFEIVHGNKSGPKPESVTLLIFENIFLRAESEEVRKFGDK